MLPALLFACAQHGPAHHYDAYPRPSTQVYFHPLHGQSRQHQSRDRYECFLWAKRQTGFDPSAAALPPHQRVVVGPPASMTGALFGAFFGALLGAPDHAAEGALIGGAVGATSGAIHDIEVAEAERRAAERRARMRHQQLEKRAIAYRRAMSACLEGRGYRVE
jgi:hypothetical protein